MRARVSRPAAHHSMPTRAKQRVDPSVCTLDPRWSRPTTPSAWMGSPLDRHLHANRGTPDCLIASPVGMQVPPPSSAGAFERCSRPSRPTHDPPSRVQTPRDSSSSRLSDCPFSWPSVCRSRPESALSLLLCPAYMCPGPCMRARPACMCSTGERTSHSVPLPRLASASASSTRPRAAADNAAQRRTAVRPCAVAAGRASLSWTGRRSTNSRPS
jgi:hypothetical protein